MSIKHLIYRKGGAGNTAKHRMLLGNENYDYSGSNPDEVKLDEEPVVSDATEEVVDPDDAVTNVEYKPGLSDEQKSDVDSTLRNIDKPIDIDWGSLAASGSIVEKSQGIIKDLAGDTQSVLAQLQKNSGANITITSGLRTAEQNKTAGLNGNPGNPNSFHLKGRAIDLRPSPELDAYLTSAAALEFLKSVGYEVVDERHRTGYAPHWHIEPRPGGVGIAKRGGLIYKR